MKKILLVLLLVPLLFAANDWRAMSGLAVVIAAMLLGLLYAIGHGMGMNDLKFLATEEIYQLVATIFLIGVVIGGEAAVNDMANAWLGDTLADSAGNVLQTRLDGQQQVLDGLQSISVGIGRESSKSAFCTIYGTGIGMSPCGSYRALSTPLSLSYQMMVTGIAELSALRTLVWFGEHYAFLMLLPLGLLLRIFRITRGAGGLLIALAITLYLLVPLGIIAMDDVSTQVLDFMESNGRGMQSLGEVTERIQQGIPTGNPLAPIRPFVPECDATSVTEANYDRAVGIFDSLRGISRTFIYEFLVHATLSVLVVLGILVGGLQALASLAGADVDTSALARLV